MQVDTVVGKERIKCTGREVMRGINTGLDNIGECTLDSNAGKARYDEGRAPFPGNSVGIRLAGTSSAPVTWRGGLVPRRPGNRGLLGLPHPSSDFVRGLQRAATVHGSTSVQFSRDFFPLPEARVQRISSFVASE
ncbi:hypothetical protein JHW43_008791 [Diplocarpon mali]|nr:hypothetical protein JHW43_008791 [Diplocarpon mali]